MTAVGWLLLGAAVALAGDVQGRRSPGPVARSAQRPGRLVARNVRVADAGLPLVLDLAAAALRAGRPLPEALALAAPAAAERAAVPLQRVAGLLRLGADPRQAWRSVTGDPALGPVVPVAIRSAGSGIKLAGAFERLAAELRAERAARAAERAQRAGIFGMAPLAACFLPSFVCLGIVPVVVGLASRALGRGP
jgi:Flp pilus assembly protein TadB